ncbi:MAG: hypothetical protein OEX00_02935 [Gammaproteobacteria bacterium]|nr:hypothetical protein [Gammaproteobacteria bacterium]MDH5693131.1 hypothetical protein [Gammaproteobacteria bacterium]
MEKIRASFGDFYFHGDGLMEAVIDEGVEVDANHIDEMLGIFKQTNPPTRFLLANRKNRYSFSFPALLKIANSKEVEYVAILKHRKKTPLLGQFLQPKFFAMAVFDDRQQAFDWLITKTQTKKAA